MTPPSPLTSPLLLIARQWQRMSCRIVQQTQVSGVGGLQHRVRIISDFLYFTAAHKLGDEYNRTSMYRLACQMNPMASEQPGLCTRSPRAL